MNADKRRWNYATSVLIAAVFASVTDDAIAADVGFQLEEEINRRFSVAEEVTAPTRIVDSAFRLTRTLQRPNPSPIILDFSYPSGKRSKGTLRDDSYHLAKENRSYRAVAMLFDDERRLAGNHTFHR
jgi:hypothetical protein